MLGRIFFIVFLMKSIKTQTVTLSPGPTVDVSVDQSLTLTCTTTYSAKFISFVDSTMKFGTTAITLGIINGACNTLSQSTGYNIQCDSVNGPFIMTIESVPRQHHNSKITCKIQYGFSTTDDIASDVTTILVNVPLAISELTPSKTVTKKTSDTVSFKCVVSGFPRATVTWLIDGSAPTTQSPPLESYQDEIVTSQIKYVAQKADNGKMITCTAGNGKHTVSASTALNIQYRPIVAISPKNNPYHVIENSTNFQLTCNVIDTNPDATSFSWTKDGSTNPGSASYNIPSVYRSHAGNYSCGAANTVGTSVHSALIQLSVLYGTEIIPISKKEPTEGTQLLITCDGQSNPAVIDNDVTWTKQNNNTFSSKGKQFVVGHVNRLDSGTFVCSVVIKLTPTVGQSIDVTSTTTVEVDVLYRPTVTITPNYTQFTVIENKTNLQLDCIMADANPRVATFRWYKNGNKLDGLTDASYTLSTVWRTHTGSYTCDATNIVGSSSPSSAVQLDVLYGLEVYPIIKNIQHEGKTISITCSGESYPVMTSSDVKWFKRNNNTFAQTGLKLVIDNVNRLDSGIYFCSVVIRLKPTIGQPVNVTGSTAVEVDILYRPNVRVSSDKNISNVIENSTNLQLTCNVIDAHPAVMYYKWYKDGTKVATESQIYTLSTVHRSHSGSYSCEASNTVGSSGPSSVLQLDVLYGVSLTLSGTDISVPESEMWELSCIGDGKPLPNIIFVYIHNSTTVGKQTANVTSIRVDYANCMDTGIYMCFGNNTIGEPVSQSVNIKVACKPRTSHHIDKRDIFINGTDKSLNISTTFISFPSSDILWYRQLPDGNFTSLDGTFIPTKISSHLPYETISILQKQGLRSSDFGIYVVKASNIHGSFIMTYHVIPKRAPDSPSNITAHCDLRSIRVTWISRFNGGENQTFRINFVEYVSNLTQVKDNIVDTGEDTILNATRQSLSADTLYTIFLESYNVYGTTKSTEFTNCITEKDENPSVTSTLIGGIAGSTSALLIVVIIIIGIYLRRRLQVPGGNRQLSNRDSMETDEEEGGLQDNPLYVTSENFSHTDVGPVYGVVNKQKQNKENVPSIIKGEQGPVYAEVQRSSTKDKKKRRTEKKGKKTLTNDKKRRTEKKVKKSSTKVKNTDIELGCVYENYDKQFNSDELYTNAGDQNYELKLSITHSPVKNKDGLIYADLDLMPGPSGKKFVIRGLENRTNYAVIDLSIKADPLSSESEDDDQNGATVTASDHIDKD